VQRGSRYVMNINLANSTLAQHSSGNESSRLDLESAPRLLNRRGVRLMEINGVLTAGVWSDLDGPEIRAALRIFGRGIPVRYLDGAGIHDKYKICDVAGEPVPMNLLAEMECHPEEPWTVRDQMLHAMHWKQKGRSWAQSKAQMINQLFKEQGATGQKGRIK